MKRKKKRKALYDMDSKRDTLLLGEVVKQFAVKYDYVIFLTSKNKVIMKRTYAQIKTWFCKLNRVHFFFKNFSEEIILLTNRAYEIGE